MSAVVAVVVWCSSGAAAIVAVRSVTVVCVVSVVVAMAVSVVLFRSAVVFMFTADVCECTYGCGSNDEGSCDAVVIGSVVWVAVR